MSSYEGTGPGGGWDLKGMAEELVRLRNELDLALDRIVSLETKLENQALIAPGSFGGYIPRNRRI